MKAGIPVALLLALLCSCRVDPDEKLRRAVSRRDADAVAALLKSGAHVDARDENGWTPLMHAAARGDAGTVRVLVSAKADVSAVSRVERQAPLTLAARWNRDTVVRELAKSGAPLEARDRLGWTALMWGAHLGRTDIVAALLEAGANARAHDQDGNTALSLAQGRNHADAAKLLSARR